MGTNNTNTLLSSGASSANPYASLATTALGIGSGVLSAVGTLKQGSATDQAAQAQSAALLAQSDQTLQSARDQATIIRRQGVTAQGAATAAAAASGVSVNIGSPQVDVAQIGAQANSDALAAITNGSRRAVALQTNAQQTSAAGTNAQKASVLSAVAGGINSLSKWKMDKNAVASPTKDTSFDNPDNYG